MNNSSINVSNVVDDIGVKRVGIDLFKGDGTYELFTKIANRPKHAEL